MSAKNNDNHNRFRSRTIAFRVLIYSILEVQQYRQLKQNRLLILSLG